MTPTDYAIIATAFVLNWIILYFVIKNAIKAGTYEIKDAVSRQLRIQIKELEKEGYNSAQIANILTKD